jgi:protein TonB
MSRLSDFHNGGRGPWPVPLSRRVLAVVLTAALYAVVAWMASQPSTWKPPRPPREIYASVPVVVVAEVPKPAQLRLPPFLAHLIKPRAETVSPPKFTIASNTPPQPASAPQLGPPPQASQPPQALLPATAAASSALAGGPQSGAGMGQGGTATGIIGVRPSGCYDAEWAQAVSDHIGKFFFYPESERRRHVTGQVFVHIGVRQNGRLALLKINRSSGVRAFDQAALDMVRRAEPLPRIPGRMHLARIDVEMPILFGDEDKSLTPASGDCGVGRNPIFDRDT